MDMQGKSGLTGDVGGMHLTVEALETGSKNFLVDLLRRTRNWRMEIKKPISK